jgi:hypothetical protein
MHRGFGEGSSTVVVGAFPVRPFEEADSFDGTISFACAGIVAPYRARSWWCNQPKSAPARPSITAAPVMGAVTDDFPGG